MYASGNEALIYGISRSVVTPNGLQLAPNKSLRIGEILSAIFNTFVSNHDDPET